MKNTTYSIWQGMISRCSHPSNPIYKHYGARGITVCSRWLNYENFIKDMGVKPENRSLDRIDNNGDYSPENCRWADSKQQARNKRNNHLITYNGETRCCAEWSEIYGVPASKIRARINKGWDLESALKTPAIIKKRESLPICLLGSRRNFYVKIKSIISKSNYWISQQLKLQFDIDIPVQTLTNYERKIDGAAFSIAFLWGFQKLSGMTWNEFGKMLDDEFLKKD